MEYSLVSALEKLWNAWELRGLVLTSLTLQIILIFMGNLRMRGWRSGLVIWFAYLVADYVATTSLGVLSGSTAIGGGGGGGDGGSNSKVTTPPSSSDRLHNGQTELIAFWSSFLLLHLGGPDTITAFSLEDNELWKRHLLGLISQVGLALYVITKSVIMKSGRWNQLLVPTVLMFLVGVLKFGERTWTFRYGSQDKLRESMTNKSDTEMEESEADVETANNTTSNTTFIVDKDIEVEDEADDEAANNTTNSTISVDESMILPEAHKLYHTFRRLIVDQILSSHDRKMSKPFFMKLTAKQAFKVIEIELSLLYEALYTKAPLVYTVPGVCFRALAFTFITISFFFFQFITDKSRYCEIDLSITYVLLVGGLALELYANALHICSDQAFLWLKQRRFNNNRWLLRLFSPKEKRYWSHSMAQYNLANDCLYKPHYIVKKMIQWIDLMVEFYKTRTVPVTEELKEFIFKELKRKLMEKEKDKKKAIMKVYSSSSSTSGDENKAKKKEWELDSSRDYKRLSDCRGERVLQDCGYLSELGWSVVNVEFDESILTWHAATDMCYIEENRSPPNEAQICKSLSDYMLYLLVFRTPMITAGIRKPYKALFGSPVEESQKNAPWEKLKSTTFLRTYKGVAPTLGKVGKSVLSNVDRLATELEKMERTEMWKMVSAVWTEMLCYAASHCRGYNHAQRLSKGGELLTFVWFLMAHLGVGQHYRKEVSHAIIQIQAHCQ